MRQWIAVSGLAAVVLAAGFTGVTGLSAPHAHAMGSEPAETKVDCRKRKNRDKKECKKKKNNNQSGQLSDDQIYQVGYWLAHEGKFAEALSELQKAENKNDPRILNYIGYSTRKLGRVDEALTFYRRALAANPDYTVARAYMGEAFLEQGKPELAREQLGEIEKRCGRACVEFTELSGQIESFAATGKFKPQGKRDSRVKQES
jgi:tetratricopeptide (TPR) repeat protein